MITASWIGATYGMKWGFFAAGIGMILSTLFLEFAKKSLGKVGLPEEGKEGWGRFFLVGAGALALSVVVFFWSGSCWVCVFISSSPASRKERCSFTAISPC
jgi:dipeptide/tripeptide permease